jgi:hypothetical protein
LCPQELGHRSDSQGGKNVNFGFSHSQPMHQKYFRNDEGNKVTKTIFTGSREFIILVDSGKIISQSPEPQSMSGAWLNNYRIFSLSPLIILPLIECSHSNRKHCIDSWRLAMLQS